MTRPSLPDDWQSLHTNHPFWCGWQHLVASFDNWPSLPDLNQRAQKQALRNQAGKRLQFTDQATAHGQRAYEALINQTGCIPTRPCNWHDFFNACAWLNFPQTKAALNHIHCQQPEGQMRTPASDAATIFDESGAVLIGPDPRLAHWLIEHDWQEAFVNHRSLWKSHHLIIIGHAVLEKTLKPYPGMITKVIYQPWEALDKASLSTPPEGLDAAIAQRWLASEFTHPRALFPLPVLGLPGADAANEQASFYENLDVFRPKQKASA